MYIKSINIEKIGCFSEIEFKLFPGINFITGINGSGKTTVLVIAYSMFQNEEMFQYNADSGEVSQIILGIEKVLNLMQKMKNIQFIITINSRIVIENIEKYNVLNLLDKNEYKRRYLSLDYRNFSKQSITKQLVNLSASDDALQETKIVKYQVNNIVDEEERRNVEFKEIKGSNPCETIVATAEIYIVAFLNSWVSGIGTIKWGINDDGRIVGVNLPRDKRDIIRRKLSERLSQIRPYLSSDLVHINFREIVDEKGELMPEQYVVEISVRAVMYEELFATSKNEVYMKTESGKRKLNAHEVQLGLKERLKRN